MKKVLLFILAFAVLSINVANAKEGFYAGGSVTMNKAQIKGEGETTKSTKPTVAIDLGYKFNFNSFTVSPELYFNLMSQVFKKDGDKLKEFGGLNVKLGYDIDSKLNTFFLVGVAYMDKYKTNIDDEKVSVKMKQPVMNLGIGAEYEVIDNLNVNLTVAYSFGKTKKLNDEARGLEMASQKYKNTKVSLGANYYFGF